MASERDERVRERSFGLVRRGGEIVCWSKGRRREREKGMSDRLGERERG